MIRPENVATPLTACALAVAAPFENVPLLNVKVTVELSAITGFPEPSCTATKIAGLRAAPAVPLAGGACRKPSLLALLLAPTVNAVEVDAIPFAITASW